MVDDLTEHEGEVRAARHQPRPSRRPAHRRRNVGALGLCRDRLPGQKDRDMAEITAASSSDRSR